MCVCVACQCWLHYICVWGTHWTVSASMVAWPTCSDQVTLGLDCSQDWNYSLRFRSILEVIFAAPAHLQLSGLRNDSKYNVLRRDSLTGAWLINWKNKTRTVPSTCSSHVNGRLWICTSEEQAKIRLFCCCNIFNSILLCDPIFK